ncbi:MAG TPA: PhzF family phenazine biosynthesis protein [Burkholderiaceae bacterium]|nr:PhzF family phenazine biosynthesis protein [Burkholderiaceae bacterium]
MRPRPFAQVDVFTTTPYRGNPLAVVLDGTDLSTEDMQRFTAWANLSEAAFLLPPTPEGAAAGADYRVRIFNPQTEYPFAGHPTLGACHAWLAQGGQPRQPGIVMQECGVGLVPVRQTGSRLAFAAPPSRQSQPSPELLARVSQALGLQATQVLNAQILDNGPTFLALQLSSRDEVLACNPDMNALKSLRTCAALVSVHPNDPDTQIEVRAFGPHLGFDEDPITGSLNASLAQWLMAHHRVPSQYVAAQGTQLNRVGRVFIDQDAKGQLWIGGESVTCIQGTVQL